MALLLAHMLVDQGRYDSEEARKAFVYWLDSGPFFCGMTVSSGLRGRPNPASQANGAMMRVSPLGIFGANPCFLQVEGVLATGIRPAVQGLCGNSQDQLDIGFQMIGKF